MLTNIRYFHTEKLNIFLGGAQSSPRPHPTEEGNPPPPRSHTLGVYGAQILRLRRGPVVRQFCTFACCARCGGYLLPSAHYLRQCTLYTLDASVYWRPNVYARHYSICCGYMCESGHVARVANVIAMQLFYWYCKQTYLTGLKPDKPLFNNRLHR